MEQLQREITLLLIKTDLKNLNDVDECLLYLCRN